MADPLRPELSQAELELAGRVRAARITLARSSGAEFNRYVLRDEETGGPVENAPMHEVWHELIERWRRLVLWAHIESGKTNGISIGRALYELGKNPNLRICIVSNTGGQATKVVRTIAKYIEDSPELHRVFPNLMPSVPWTHNSITVVRGDQVRAKDPSVTATGVHGAVLGSRFDLIILDDILDYENVRTPAQREELVRWYKSTLAGRLTANGRIIVVGTAWHPDDLMHVLSRGKNFKSQRFPVQEASGESTWEQRWPLDRIADKRIELGELEASRQLDCKGVDESTSRFKEPWITLAKRMGDGYVMLPTLQGIALPDGVYAATGVDLGFTKNRAGAKTVFTTALFYPDGMRQLLWIDAGNFSGPEIVQKALQHHQRFGGPVYVESNGAQKMLLDFALDPMYGDMLRDLIGEGFDPNLVPILPFQTGTNKWHPIYGVESIGVEMANGKWIFPSEADEVDPIVEGLLGDLRNYNPLEHTGDFLMSLWIVREGGRGWRGATAKITARVISPERPAQLGRGSARARLIH